MADYEERVGLIGGLAAAYPGVEITDQTIKTYVWSLNDLALPTLKAAIDRCALSAKFFPSIAEIREFAGAISADGGTAEHPTSCRCFGTGMYTPDGRDEAGYRLGAQRCVGAMEGDPAENW